MIALTETAILSSPLGARASRPHGPCNRHWRRPNGSAGGTPALPGRRATLRGGHPMSPTTGRTKAEDYIGAPNRPFTGKEYLESLRDGRVISIYGERVPVGITPPAFPTHGPRISQLYAAPPHLGTRAQ